MLQKKKAEGPTDPEQPAKKQKLPPAPAEANHTPIAMESHDPDTLKTEIEAQGNKIRELKAAAADKVYYVNKYS